MEMHELDAPKLGGIILAGGRSSRMGQEKGWVDFRGRPMVAYAQAALAEVAGPCCVVAHDPRYAALGLPVVADEMPGSGPLGGLLSGMGYLAAQTDCTAVLVVPCDMPLLGADHLRNLADHYRPGMSALVASSGGRVHPLVGIYATDTLAAFVSACKEGRLRMMDLLKDISAATLEFPAELAGEAFININTPEELLR